MLAHFLTRSRGHLEAPMVSHNMGLRVHTVRSSLIGPFRCDPRLGLRGALLTDNLQFLTCADLPLAWQECVLLLIEALF